MNSSFSGIFSAFKDGSGVFLWRAGNMSVKSKNEEFHQRLALLIGTEEPFRWAKRMKIPSATFDRIWNKYDIPKHEHLCRIARCCGVSLDWLLLGDDPESVSNPSTYKFMPLVGLANCGIAQGWFNESDLSSQILLPSFMFSESVFAVLCRGSSMIPAGINDGNVCIIYPDRAVQSGKPVLIRTKSYVNGREMLLSTIKVFNSEDSDSIYISGWLDPDETGYQSLFTEKRSKSCVTMMAPVGNILPINVSESPRTSCFQTVLDKTVLTECLDMLRPLYSRMKAKDFSDMVCYLYEERVKNGGIDGKTILHLMEEISEKIKK